MGLRVKDLDEVFDFVLGDVRRGGFLVVYGGKFRETLVVTDRGRYVIERSCVGELNSCSRRLLMLISLVVGSGVVERLYRSLREFLLKRYKAESLPHGILAYPFEVEIRIDGEMVMYVARFSKEELKVELPIIKMETNQSGKENAEK